MAPDLCGDHRTPPHFSCLCPTFSPTERLCVHLLATSQDFLQNHRYERERDYISKVLEGSISSWGLLKWLQHPWSHPFFCPLIILRNGIYFLPFPEKIQLCYSKITWWMMGNWIFMNLAQHWEAWLAIHKGQNLNNSHDFKNNQEEKICRKAEQICLFILLSKDNWYRWKNEIFYFFFAFSFVSMKEGTENILLLIGFKLLFTHFFKISWRFNILWKLSFMLLSMTWASVITSSSGKCQKQFTHVWILTSANNWWIKV